MVEFRNDNDDENQPDTNPIIDLPSYDLPDKLFVNKDKELENKYTVNLDDLRKEREIELKKKEEEQRQMEEKEKRARYEAILANRPKKEFDGEKFTFDPNGAIIPIKPPTLELLASEFWWSNPNIRDKSPKKAIAPKGRRRSTMRRSIVAITNSNQNSPNRMQSSKEITSINTSITRENKDTVTTRRQSILMLESLTNPNAKPITPIKPNFLENPDTLTISSPRKSIAKKESIVYNVNPANMYNWKSQKQKDNNIPIVVSGENFTLIHPEIGVVVTSEENTKKEGGMEFSQKFNKPSMEEFSKMVIASQNLNSKRFLSMSIDSTQNENIPYQGYKKQFGADTNLLIENAQRILGMNLKDTTSQLPSLIKSTDIKNNYRYNPFISENYSSMKLGNDINNIKSYLDGIRKKID